MPELSPARLLQVHLAESDMHGAERLYEAVVRKCREAGIAGATVFRGLEGYGGISGIRRPHLAGHDLPVIVTIVDTPDNLARLTPALEEMVASGAIVAEEVRVLRVRKAEAS
jgi:uncharacterized protein